MNSYTLATTSGNVIAQVSKIDIPAPAKPLFYWNGIKDAKGAELQKCFYAKGNLAEPWPEETITVYGKDYKRFSALVRQNFAVENDTDTMTDYFENDSFRVLPNHPLYHAVLTAYKAQETHDTALHSKRKARRERAAA